MHPVIRRPAADYMHAQTVTTRGRCGRNGMHESSRELSAHRGIGIASDQVESKVSKVARGGKGGGGGAGAFGGDVDREPEGGWGDVLCDTLRATD